MVPSFHLNFFDDEDNMRNSLLRVYLDKPSCAFTAPITYIKTDYKTD